MCIKRKQRYYGTKMWIIGNDRSLPSIIIEIIMTCAYIHSSLIVKS